MAVTVQFYIFAKRENSTKQPSGTAAFTANCELKNPTSVINPEIILNISTNPTAMNYAYIEAFDRYYFVNDWTWVNGLWAASLAVDALASWKTSIGNSSQYVLRSASQKDGAILDMIYPTSGVITNSADEQTRIWTGTSFTNGTYVVGIINKDVNAVGAVSYYAFTNSQFRKFCTWLMDTAHLDISDISDNLTKALVNPFQYIASCKWFPMSITGANISTLTYGWWQYSDGSTVCARLSGLTWTNAGLNTFTLPLHPQLSRGAYTRLAPYTRYELFYPPFGTIPLDPARLVYATTITTAVYVDYITGKANLRLLASGNPDSVTPYQIGWYSGVIAVDIQLSQMTTDVMGVTNKALSGVSSVVSKLAHGNIIGAITGGVSAIASTAESAMPQVQTSGENGSSMIFAFNPVLTATFYNMVDDDNSHLGSPLCKTKTIKTLSGYILCESAEVAIAGTDGERKTISGYMNSGFFYE